MKKIYTYLLYALLGVEMIVFAGFFIRGPQGLRTLNDMYVEQESMQAGLAQMTQEVAVLKQDINNWNKHSFHKEKIAREQLQMARADDEVFYLS
jgi:cell division protein FtsB